MLEGYYTPHFVQTYEDVNTGAAPPHDKRSERVDGEKISGWFQEKSSDPILIALAQGADTIGYFFTAVKADVQREDVVRCPDTGFYIQLIGDDLARISRMSTEPHKKFPAKVIERSD